MQQHLQELAALHQLNYATQRQVSLLREIISKLTLIEFTPSLTFALAHGTNVSQGKRIPLLFTLDAAFNFSLL